MLQEWLGIRNVMSALFCYACNVSSKRSHTKDIEVCVLSAIIGFPMLTQALLLALYCTCILNYNINLDLAATESNGGLHNIVVNQHYFMPLFCGFFSNVFCFVAFNNI